MFISVGLGLFQISLLSAESCFSRCHSELKNNMSVQKSVNTNPQGTKGTKKEKDLSKNALVSP